MADAARRASAGRVTAVIPYFGYARQDRKDQPRVPITAKLVANLLVAAGVNRVITMDLHAQQLQGFFDIPVDHLYALPVILEHLAKLDISNIVVVSPDVGGVKMAAAYSQALGANLAIVAKRRVSATAVEGLHVIGDVAGRTALLVDDITETAGTLTSAAQMLLKNGASAVYAAVSHAVLTKQGIERLLSSPIRKLISTDSVPRHREAGENILTVSVAGLLGEAIQRIHDCESVSSLFEIKPPAKQP